MVLDFSDGGFDLDAVFFQFDFICTRVSPANLLGICARSNVKCIFILCLLGGPGEVYARIKLQVVHLLKGLHLTGPTRGVLAHKKIIGVFAEFLTLCLRIRVGANEALLNQGARKAWVGYEFLLVVGFF